MQCQMDALGQELAEVEETISQWCMRMAWPGGTPNPPINAWMRRAEIWGELKSLGVKLPKYEHIRWRERMREKS